MNFELKTLDLKAAAGFNTDAVIVLLPSHFKPGRDPISQLISKARANADLDDVVGKLLVIWHPESVKTARLILVSSGDGSARSVRTATTDAVGALKSANPKSIAVCLPDGAQQRVHAVVQAVSDASYVFTTTKPSAKASLLKRVTVGLPTPEKVKVIKSAFSTATAVAQGVALASQRLGCRALIVMPETTPRIKVDAVRALGAEVVLHAASDARDKTVVSITATGLVRAVKARQPQTAAKILAGHIADTADAVAKSVALAGAPGAAKRKRDK